MLRQTTIKNGKVRGLPGNDPRISVYKGIPFAVPPVGDLRWKAPQPCEDWEGTLEAYNFGPISVQDQPAVGTDIYCKEWHVDPDIPMSILMSGHLPRQLMKSSPFSSGYSAEVFSGDIQLRWNLTASALHAAA